MRRGWSPGMRGVLAEVVLPGRPGVEGPGRQLVRPDPPCLRRPWMPIFWRSLSSCLVKDGVYAVAIAARGLAEQAGPDAGQPGLLLQPVPAEHHEPLDVVELAVQVRRGQEHGLLYERDPHLQIQFLGRPLELGLELFGLAGRSGAAGSRSSGPGRHGTARSSPCSSPCPGWLLISTRKSPAGAAMSRSTSRTWPDCAVKVNVCQARYGGFRASGRGCA